MELRKAQYENIMRAYEKRRMDNHEIQVTRQNEVYKKIPQFKALCDSVSQLSLREVKALLSGEKTSLKSLKSEISKLAEKKKEVLLAAGFPADYLDPVYTCKDCKDTGYIDNKKCHCLKQAIIQQLYKQSNIKEMLAFENFEKFNAELYSESFIDARTGRSSRRVIEDALVLVHHFIDAFGQEFNNLFLYGGVGVGKTFLSNCTAKEIMDKGFSVLYFSAANLFNAVAGGLFQKNDPDCQYLNDQIFACDLLVIDDLGTEYDNTFVSCELFSIINERILNKKSTIISTNLSLMDLKDRYTERCFSRITSNYTLIKLIGDDLRLKKKLQKI